MFDISTEIKKIKFTKDIRVLVNLLMKSACTNPKIYEILTHLIHISSIEFTDTKTSTAAIEYSCGRYYLWFNLNFITNYIKTTNCLLFVVLHELYHKIYADFFLKLWNHYKNVSHKLLNIVCDLKINSDLYKTFFKQSGIPPVIEKFYFKEEANVIQKLFCPPEVLFKNEPEILLQLNCFNSKFLHPETEQKITKKLLSGHSRQLINNTFFAKLVLDTYLYVWLRKKTDTSFSELFNMVKKILQLLSENSEIILTTIPLIGTETVCDEKYRDEESCKICKKNKICQNRGSLLPKNVVDKFKRCVGYYLQETERKTDKVNKLKSAEFYNAVLSALSFDCSNPIIKEQMLPEYGFIPQFTRRETFLIASGFVPVVYQTPLPKREYDEMKVHVYIDVSGSTMLVWQIYYGLILALSEVIGSPVYLFSNKVIEAKLNDIKKGIVRTTGGTDIDCVIQHALKKNFYRILLLTDGYVSVDNINVQLAKSKPIKFYAVFSRIFLEKKISADKNFVPDSELFSKGLLSPKDRNRTWWILQDYIRM